jgi:hypothetical protein
MIVASCSGCCHFGLGRELLVRWRLLLPVGGLVLMSAFAPSAQATSSISQSDYSVSVDATTAVAQTFQMGSTAERLGNVQIYVVDVPSHDVTVTVFATAAGKPTGSPLGTVDDSSSDSGAWNSFNFGLTFALSANTTYAIEVQAAGTIGGTCATSAYAGGTALFQSGGGWVSDDPSAASPNCVQDLAFSVQTAPIPGTVLDQHQDGHGVGAISHEELSVSNTMAQTFRPAVSGTLDGISLWTFGTMYAPQVTVTVQIRTVSGGLPTGKSLASDTSTSSVLAQATSTVSGIDGTWVDFAFSSPPTLWAGTEYAIVFDGFVGWCGSSQASSYPNGRAFAFDPDTQSWVAETDLTQFSAPATVLRNWTFRTYMTASGATPPPTSAALPSGSASQAPLFPIAALMAASSVMILLVARRAVPRSRG